jgi:hypothetical protein
MDFLIMGVKKSLERHVEAIFQPGESPDNSSGNPAEALRKLMEFYESGETENDEENDAALINRLYGRARDDMPEDY